jgi:hypothetical protein
MELDLSMEDAYDFVKFMLKLQQFRSKIIEMGIINLIPVGSAVTKSVRRASFMIDIILNFNKASLLSGNNKPDVA